MPRTSSRRCSQRVTMIPVVKPTISVTVSSLALGPRPEVLRDRPQVSLLFKAPVSDQRIELSLSLLCFLRGHWGKDEQSEKIIPPTSVQRRQIEGKVRNKKVSLSHIIKLIFNFKAFSPLLQTYLHGFNSVHVSFLVFLWVFF